MENFIKEQFLIQQQNHAKLVDEFHAHMIDFAGFKGKLLGLSIAASLAISTLMPVLMKQIFG